MSTEQTPTAETTWTNRIQALLTKAESTAEQFPEEAEALLAKAQELMVRHAIDEAALTAAGRASTDQVTSDIVTVEAPYATAKASLLGAVGHANECRVVMSSAGEGAQRCVVVGHESDLANVRTLFSALSLHAVRTMLNTPVPRRDTPRRFRRAFLLAFAARVGERLQAAASSVRRQAEADATTGAGVAIVLADRSAAVDDAFRESFPGVRSRRLQASSAAGISSGRRAAEQANLGQQGLGGLRRALRR